MLISTGWKDDGVPNVRERGSGKVHVEIKEGGFDDADKNGGNQNESDGEDEADIEVDEDGSPKGRKCARVNESGDARTVQADRKGKGH
jgi:hypothetical protein